MDGDVAVSAAPVFGDLVGQERVVAQLDQAAAVAARLLRGENALGMTHAWLFTGPPGSGRSVAARAFAAARTGAAGSARAAIRYAQAPIPT
jgi:DNA polymerase-3 subunit delta'